MKRVLFCVLIILLDTAQASSVQIGAQNIIIPAPPGTNELCVEELYTREEIQKSVSGGYSLLTCFINKERWASNSQEYVYLVTADKRAVTPEFSVIQFQSIKKNYDTGMVQYAKAVKAIKAIKANPDNPERLKQVQHINDITVDHFERFLSTESAELLIEREKMDMQINGQRVVTNAIVASGLVWAKGKIFSVKMSKYLLGRTDFSDEDFSDVKKRLTAWVTAISENNKT